MLFAEGFSKELSYLFAGSVNIIIGIFTIFAAKSFQKILDQQGDVLVALITSFKYQSQLYSLQFWIYSAAAFVMLLGTAASFILETSHIKINR
ncbi:MAG TPA: hypothetical protein PK453_04655 [Leptospiraceae bacterium]|nr:hypothetical protein [Leptospiraceae bacterium]HNF12937.1 hypothetical protein [Leptospiraceae bacterium]HNM05777.1 hypothetical protein [Leptospiraceae bacterium]